MTEQENLDDIEDLKKESKRLKWIDQGRGFVVFLLVLMVAFPPSEWKPEGSIIFFLFGHPGSFDTYMTVYDIGAAAFIFVIGLVFSMSFQKRLEKNGMSSALKHVIIRYGLLLLLGYIILFAEGELVKFDDRLPGVPILRWDVIPTLGLVGFVTLPFVFIKKHHIRMLIGYAWIIIYQILMITTPLKLYAQLSIHGGIFGTVFGYSGVMIIATALGDYMVHADVEDKVKYKNMGIFGAINLIGGILIAFIPGWEASKRQVSFTHCIISIAVCCLGLLVFVYLNKYKDKELGFLQAFGRNPFLVYAIAEIPVFILEETVGADLGLGWVGNIIVTLIILTYTSITVMYLYKNRKIISTEKSTVIFIVVVVILAVILISTGVI